MKTGFVLPIGPRSSVQVSRDGTSSARPRLLIMALVFAALSGQAAVTEAWVRYDNMGAYANDQAYKVVRDAANNIFVTGSSGTIKYSGVDGSELWRKQSPRDNRAAAVDANGNVVVAGYSAGVSSSDYYTAKYAGTDGTLLWEKRYNGPGNGFDWIHAVVVDPNGNIIVTGSSGTIKYSGVDGTELWQKQSSSENRAVAVDVSGNVLVTGSGGGDYYTAKFAAADGALLWERRYNGPANNSDYAFALAVDPSGNVVVTGSSDSGSGFPNYSNDYYTAKYASANGAMLWEKRYSRPGNRYAPANAVAVDSSGNVIMTGCSDTSGGSYDYYTAKYAAANGALLWETRYNQRWDFPAAVTVDASDNVVVTGTCDRRLDDLDLYDGDYCTVKYAATDGALIWARRYQGVGVSQARSVVVDVSGNVVVTGSFGNGHSDDYYTAKYAAADGTLLWEKRSGGFSSSARSKDQAQAVAVDGSGNVVITGSSHNGESYDYYTAKHAAASGALLWRQRYDGPSAGNDYATSMAVDSSGNVVVIGWSEDDDNYTAKYAAADGALLWEKRSTSLVNAMAMDGSGNVVVTGSSEHGSNYYTAKFAAANGALLWEKRYQGSSGPSHYVNFGVAIAVDTLGDVIVTGTADDNDDNDGEANDFYTAKYAATDGALLWERRYNGPANNSDRAQAVAVDGNGNVAVTGFSYNGTNDEYYTTKYTAKYASANGALLWEKRYYENSCSEPIAMTVDSGGNVLVTGTACNGTNDEYYTAKFAAADGAVLWERRYHGSNSQGDYAAGIAVDASGNAVVTGNSYNNSEDSDYYTVKYAAADGALIWEERYGGSFGQHFPAGVAVGPNGMVAITGTFFDGDTGEHDYLTIVYRENLLPVSIAVVPTGVRLRFPGAPGHSYKIERAPTVTGPWSTRATLLTPTNSIIEYVETNAPPGSAFYRTSTP